MSTFAVGAALVLAAAPVEPDAKRDPYPEGERLEYRVKVKGLPGGTAELSVAERGKTDDRETATLRLHMYSNAFVSKFYPLDDRWTSVLETGTGGTLSFRFDKNERNRRELEEITVDPATLAGTYFRRRDNGAEERRDFSVEAPLQDSLSLFYHVRRLPLVLGTTDTVSVLHRDKAHELKLMVDGLEQVAVPGVGVVWAKIVHPSVGPGIFSEQGRATLWLDQKTHVMLRMVVEAPKGSASMALVKVERSPLLEPPGPGGGSM